VRILFYVEALDIGGANQTTVSNAIAMKKRGHEVHLASREGPLLERLLAAGVSHHRVETHVRHPSQTAAKSLGELLDRERIEVACPNGWDCLADMLLATVPRGIPVVPTFSSIYPEYHHPRVPNAIVFSGEYRDALIRDFGWQMGSLEMLISRIDTDRFRPGLDGSELRHQWGVESETPVILMACRWDPMKIEGIRFLLDSVESLARRCPRARVVLAGEGPLEAEVKGRVAELNSSIGNSYVILAGKVLAMEKAFSAAQIVIGNGARSGMEGLACGKPVISVGPSGLAGIMAPENIEDFAYYNFDKGRVYDGTTRQDREALAECVDQILEDHELRDRLELFGRGFSLQRLSVDSGAERLEALLRDQKPLGRGERLKQRWELGRAVVSYLWFAGRRKIRRLLLGSPGKSRATFEDSAGAPSFARNSATTFLTGVFALGVGALQVGITARILGPAGKGELTAALLLPGLFAILAPLGIDWASMYHLGKKTFSRDTLVRTVLAALLILGGAGVVACLGASYFLRDRLFGGVSPAAVWVAVLTIPTQLSWLFLGGFYRGEMRIAEANLMDVGRSTLRFLLIVTALVVLRWSVLGVVLAQVLAESLMTVLALRYLGGVKLRPMLQWDVLSKLLAFGIQIYSCSLFLYLNYRVDLFLVRSKLDLYQTGLYSTAVTLAEILWMVPNSLGTVLFPSMARSSEEGREALTLAICRSSFWMMAILCGILALGRNLALRFIFGERFVEAGPALLGLLPGILAMSLQFILGTALSGRGRPLPVALGAAIGFGANVFLNLAWIPRYGILGASLASSVSYTLVTLVVLIAYLRISDSRLRDAILLRKEDLRRLAGAFGRLKEAVA
jgi:O-antigen/teichoic acid export membrane protein/glycosyltransferase involved in cell wall biosynthesis